ncbi:hypothetical protein HZC34_04935 [Candidatus Saganbacteria bacterium]|nr:hypothetical protein [Candidatus Saganbacteria bacterium]
MINMKPDWTQKKFKEYFTFASEIKSDSPDIVYYGELITLLNPNIKRSTIEAIPEHIDEKPERGSVDINAMKKLIGSDSTLMANPYQIKRIKPPED